MNLPELEVRSQEIWEPRHNEADSSWAEAQCVHNVLDNHFVAVDTGEGHG